MSDKYEVSFPFIVSAYHKGILTMLQSLGGQVTHNNLCQ